MKTYLFLLLLLLCATQARASAVYAVVVGVSDYQFGGATTDLRFADDDAVAFANFLRSAAGGGVPAQHMRLLTNAQASRQNIVAALNALFGKAKPDDKIIFFFFRDTAAAAFLCHTTTTAPTRHCTTPT